MFGLSDSVINEICDILRRHPIVEQAVIFGSRAKGCHTEGSDIDIAVKAHGLSYNELLDINIQIEDLGLLYKVDVVDYFRYAGTPLGAHIDRVGCPIYTRSRQ